MELKDFIENFAEQFDETDASEINANTIYKELDEWSSLTSMSIIAMVKTVYGKAVTGKDIRDSRTVEDLFRIIDSK